jgi:hypothetical protein
MNIPITRTDAPVADASLTALTTASILQPEFPPLHDLTLKHYGQIKGELDSAWTSRQTATPTPFGGRGARRPAQVAR